jgi:hypothetical protein
MNPIVMSLRDLMHTDIFRMVGFNNHGLAPGFTSSQTHPFRGYLHGALLMLQNDGVREM